MWANLEKRCRNWAVQNGSVHIITGPVIRGNYSTIGSNKVTVPQWYYKICVSIKNQKAIAFLIPNRKPQKILDSFVVTIDKLEEVTGLDFLDKVPGVIENKVESASDIKQWGLKVTTTPKKPQTKGPKALGNYWISINSNKRHNSSCRWFQKSKGKFGSKSTGVACKNMWWVN